MLTFGPGIQSQVASIPVVDDDLAEIDELFYGNLRLPAGSIFTVEFDPGRANATILDNGNLFYYAIIQESSALLDSYNNWTIIVIIITT